VKALTGLNDSELNIISDDPDAAAANSAEATA
jgi:hypothetical protein